MQEITASLKLTLSDTEIQKIELYMQMEAILGHPLTFNQALSEILNLGLKRYVTVLKYASSLLPEDDNQNEKK